MSDKPTEAEDWSPFGAQIQAGNSPLAQAVLDSLADAGIKEAELAKVRSDRTAAPESISDAAQAFRAAEAQAQENIAKFMAEVAKEEGF